MGMAWDVNKKIKATKRCINSRWNKTGGHFESSGLHHEALYDDGEKMKINQKAIDVLL